ncbi:MAG TPA: hypothetical protein ACFYD7_12275 [Candidatus Wujingus californicus]|uniref:hypothetical protein n=1 Tax=Candidatus Wujingus californicus TaxID=3367618 RepID=UPI0040286745
MIEAKTVKHDWRDIFRAFKMAFDPKKMLLGYIGILSSLIWCTMAVVFFSSLKMINTSPSAIIKLVLYSAREGIPVVFRNFLLTIVPLDFGELIIFAIITIGLLIIWSIIGGAITRIASLDYAREDSIRLIDALKFSRKKFWSYFWSPLVPVIGVFFFALCNVIGGLVGRVPVLGDVMVAVGFPLALLSGLLMVLIGVIGALGLCFMYPTISAEGSDAFDAMSRAYSYVISRPKQYILYCTTYTLFGVVCLIIVAFTAWLMVSLSLCTVGVGMGQKFATVQSFILQKCNIACLGFCSERFSTAQTTAVSIDHWSLKFLAGMLILYILLIKVGVWTFVASYIFSAKTIVYFLLRRDVDNTDISDVYIEESTEEAKKLKNTERDTPSLEGNKGSE